MIGVIQGLLESFFGLLGGKIWLDIVLAFIQNVFQEFPTDLCISTNCLLGFYFSFLPSCSVSCVSSIWQYLVSLLEELLFRALVWFVLDQFRQRLELFVQPCYLPELRPVLIYWRIAKESPDHFWI